MLLHTLSQTALCPEVVHSFQRKRERRWRFGAEYGAESARVVHSFAIWQNARMSPVTPQRAPRRWLLGMPNRAEKPSSPVRMVEETDLESKLSRFRTRPENGWVSKMGTNGRGLGSRELCRRPACLSGCERPASKTRRWSLKAPPSAPGDARVSAEKPGPAWDGPTGP